MRARGTDDPLREIRNLDRKIARLKSNGDLKRLRRLRDVQIPALKAEIELRKKIMVAAIQAQIIQAVINRPRPRFRRSYRFEAYLEGWNRQKKSHNTF